MSLFLSGSLNCKVSVQHPIFVLIQHPAHLAPESEEVPGAARKSNVTLSGKIQSTALPSQKQRFRNHLLTILNPDTSDKLEVQGGGEIFLEITQVGAARSDLKPGPRL